ncbi:MAG: DedA family protein [Firmicutes bacterium]|uniref:VTT domain-containing protein n=1 Tax=Sulfobacillus benefaciens TaxID=453960 RepID=A0A2T2WW43_9FIRM|nr:DedA family protein [Bacillota bacterium]MCL5013526.1 DedA family protein [Bacillota bacterium]PSR26446.1 MAG: hypothetical protein C7B43_13980 [Sulfobacillus benefaciens]
MAILHGITSGLLGLGVIGVFIGMFLESAYIPVPSEIILPYAGYLVFLHRATLLEAMLAGLLGGLFGAVFGYWIARYGGRPLVERYGKYVFIHQRQIDRAERWFQRHGDGAVFFGRLLPGIRTYISLPAGVAEMSFGRFFLFSLLGALPWTLLFTYMGFVLGQNWQHLGRLGIYFAGAVIILLIAWAAMLWRNRAKTGH